VVGLKKRLQALSLDPQRSQVLKETGTYQLIRVQRP
jgi:hypothetical protein